ncbi:MAG TPA: hypothetical protein VLV78_16705 [Thermoanaerobaculia bacterium]|nr:hypothetical protein [Thermoanaerobaculia bacterium]
MLGATCRRVAICPSCGAPQTNADRSTLVQSASDPSSGSFKHGRFLPGTLLGERFRIVAMLGRGGMGEVFRADDLKVGAVATRILAVTAIRKWAANC